MRIRTVIIAAAIAVAASAGVAALPLQAPPPGQTQKPPAKPEPKPDAKPEPAPDNSAVAGKWNVTVNSANGVIESLLDLKADPKDKKKITGTIASQMGEAVLEGEFAEGKLSFAFTMNANGTQVNVAFTGKFQKDGSLAGTLDFGQGEVTWTATRAK